MYASFYSYFLPSFPSFPSSVPPPFLPSLSTSGSSRSGGGVGGGGVLPDAPAVSVVLRREGGPQAAVDEQDHDGDWRLGQRNSAPGRGVLHRLIG